MGALLGGAGVLAAVLLIMWRSDRRSFGRLIVSEESVVGAHVEEEVASRSKKDLVISYLAILSGMLSVAIYRNLRRDGVVEVRSIGVEFILGALVSPLVFGYALKGQGIVVDMKKSSLVIHGYQAGFFWETIFSELGGLSER